MVPELYESTAQISPSRSNDVCTMKMNMGTEGEECVSKEIWLKELKQMFWKLETLKKYVINLDPNVKRNMLVQEKLENIISHYDIRELFFSPRKQYKQLYSFMAHFLITVLFFPLGLLGFHHSFYSWVKTYFKCLN